MTIHSGDDFARRGPEVGLDLGPHGEWPRRPPQTRPRHPNVTLRNKKRAVTPDPNDDTFECNSCHRVLDIDESTRLGRGNPLICTRCADQVATPDWNQAASDSTNMAMLEHGLIQPEDL